jgi:hypothetical protein
MCGGRFALPGCCCCCVGCCCQQLLLAAYRSSAPAWVEQQQQQGGGGSPCLGVAVLPEQVHNPEPAPQLACTARHDSELACLGMAVPLVDG